MSEVIIRRRFAECCGTGGDSVKYKVNNLAVVPGLNGIVHCIATDVRVASIVETSGEVDGVRLIPKSLLRCPKRRVKQLALKGGQWHAKKGVILGGKFKSTSTVEKVAEEPQDSRFPPIETVIPDIGPEDTVLRLDARLLAKLAKAISETGQVTLFFRDGQDAIAVAGSDGIGVLMQSNKNPSEIESERDNYKMMKCRFVESVKRQDPNNEDLFRKE